MLPAVALIGRPNVGKSTLFNRLTRSRDALVADYPGLTRDRRYGYARFGGRPYIVIDTGGLGAGGELEPLVEKQVDAALEQADTVILVVDHRDGITAEDERIAERLRRSGKRVTVAVNKAEGVDSAVAVADFFRLGSRRSRRAKPAMPAMPAIPVIPVIPVIPAMSAIPAIPATASSMSTEPIPAHMDRSSPSSADRTSASRR